MQQNGKQMKILAPIIIGGLICAIIVYAAMDQAQKPAVV
jgi:hypothetical protein